MEVDNEFVGSDQNVSPYSFFAFNPFQNDEGYYKLETVKLSKGKVTVSPDANERGINTTKYIYDHVARGLYALLNTKTQSLILIWVN